MMSSCSHILSHGYFLLFRLSSLFYVAHILTKSAAFSNGLCKFLWTYYLCNTLGFPVVQFRLFFLQIKEPELGAFVVLMMIKLSVLKEMHLLCENKLKVPAKTKGLRRRNSMIFKRSYEVQRYPFLQFNLPYVHAIACS